MTLEGGGVFEELGDASDDMGSPDDTDGSLLIETGEDSGTVPDEGSDPDEVGAPDEVGGVPLDARADDVEAIELVLAENVSPPLCESGGLMELVGGSNMLPVNVPDGDGPVERMSEFEFEEGAAVPASEADDHSDSLDHDQREESSSDQSDETTEEWPDESTEGEPPSDESGGVNEAGGSAAEF